MASKSIHFSGSLIQKSDRNVPIPPPLRPEKFIPVGSGIPSKKRTNARQIYHLSITGVRSTCLNKHLSDNKVKKNLTRQFPREVPRPSSPQQKHKPQTTQHNCISHANTINNPSECVPRIRYVTRTKPIKKSLIIRVLLAIPLPFLLPPTPSPIFQKCLPSFTLLYRGPTQSERQYWSNLTSCFKIEST